MNTTMTLVDDCNEWQRRILAALEALRSQDPLSDAQVRSDPHYDDGADGPWSGESCR